ncbi:MAG TPA: hypothetical protein DCM08_05720 [Microscillaceae bacterium]|nr:hypothetical protein [Microscillaceae bacterium]
MSTMHIFEADTSAGAWENHLSALPLPFRESVGRLQQAQDRRNSIVGKWLLQTALRELFQLELHSLTYALSPQGKPFLVEFPDLHFNISHAHQRVVCALRTTQPVGIDIEQVRPIALADFRDTFSPDNWQQIAFAAEPYSLFFKYWTMKEAVLKYTGDGLVEPLSTLHIEKEVVWWQGKPYAVQSHFRPDGYGCSWAVADASEVVHHQIIETPSKP